MTVETFTDAVVDASGRPPSDPAVQAAQSAALAVQAAAPADLEIHLRAWRQAVAGLAGGEGVRTVDDLVARALGLPAIPGLGAGLGGAVVAGDARLLAGRDVGGALGPLTVGAYLPAVTARAGRTALIVGLARPAGYSARIDTGPLTASGGAVRDAAGISGHLAATVGSISAGAFARLTTAPAPGVAAVLGVRFTPGVQVGFGFELSTVGGAVAVGLGPSVEALRGALADGSAVGLFFPADPADRASRLPLLGRVFTKHRPGTTVAGPSAELTWLQVAGVSFLRLSLVALLELPRGRLMVLGRAVVEVPPVLSFRLDVLGEVDPPHGVVALDLVIVEGRVLGIFRAAGTMALRVRTADPPHALVTLGGFFPGYRPDVPGLPEQRRISLGPDLPLPLTIRFEGYLAVTDGTFQAGASIEIRFSVGITVRGHISFDLIAQLDPVHVHARVEGGVEVRALGVTVGGVRFRGTVDGPGPLVLAGEVSVRVLGVKAGWNDRFVLERSTRSHPPPVHDLVGLVVTGQQRLPGHVRNPVDVPPSALRATEATDPLVADDAPTSDGEHAVVPAHGALVWTQTVAPFDTPLTRVGGRRLQGVAQLRLVGSPGVTAGPTEQFSPASFVEADQATLLALPAYERLASGFQVRPGTAEGRSQTGAIGYLEVYKGEEDDPVDGAASLGDAGALAMLSSVWDAAVSTVGTPHLRVHAEEWEVRTPGHRPHAHPSRSAAVMCAPAQRDPHGTGMPGLARPVASAKTTPAVPVADLADLWTA